MKKIFKILILIIIIFSSTLTIIYLSANGFFFSSWGRYDETKIEMEVPWEKANDINAWREGYSDSDDCPWGFDHNGLDFFFNDSADVLAMAPGFVESIELRDFGGDENRYHVKVVIRFSREIKLTYGFEPWTTTKSKAEKQIDDLKIKAGDWVSTGDKIADFVAYEDGAHIHFDFEVNGENTCPKEYFSDDGYDDMMNLIHYYEPDWKMCYD